MAMGLEPMWTDLSDMLATCTDDQLLKWKEVAENPRGDKFKVITSLRQLVVHLYNKSSKDIISELDAAVNDELNARNESIDIGKKFEYHKEYTEAVYKDRVYKWFTNSTRDMSDSELQRFVDLCMKGNLTFQCADEIDIDDPDISMIDHLLMDIASEKNDELINTYTDEIDWDNDYIEKYNNSHSMSRKYYELLARRVRILEAMIIEGKRDQEILQNFLGDDYYNKYQLIKNKIKDPEYKDIYKMIKMDPDEVKSYIDNFQSNTDIRRSNKQGATKLYEDDEWIVYRITTYPAAQLYGKNTRWCITGRYAGHEERGEEYFYNYIKNNNLDGGYYFYINKNDPYTKFCVLQKENGRIHSIWDAGDTNMGKSSVDLPTDLPEVEGVNLKRAKTKKDLLIRAINHDDDEAIKELVNKGLSPNTMIKKNSALAFAIDNDKVHAVKALLECGADADETSAGDWTLIFSVSVSMIITILLAFYYEEIKV